MLMCHSDNYDKLRAGADKREFVLVIKFLVKLLRMCNKMSCVCLDDLAFVLHLLKRSK